MSVLFEKKMSRSRGDHMHIIHYLFRSIIVLNFVFSSESCLYNTTLAVQSTVLNYFAPSMYLQVLIVAKVIEVYCLIKIF